MNYFVFDLSDLLQVFILFFIFLISILAKLYQNLLRPINNVHMSPFSQELLTCNHGQNARNKSEEEETPVF